MMNQRLRAWHSCRRRCKLLLSYVGDAGRGCEPEPEAKLERQLGRFKLVSPPPKSLWVWDIIPCHDAGDMSMTGGSPLQLAHSTQPYGLQRSPRPSHELLN